MWGSENITGMKTISSLAILNITWLFKSSGSNINGYAVFQEMCFKTCMAPIITIIIIIIIILLLYCYCKSFVFYGSFYGFTAIRKISKSDYLICHICLYVYASTGLSVRPHATTQLALDGFWLNLIFELLSKICRGNSSFIKIQQK
jgi:hypothetical protein